MRFDEIYTTNTYFASNIWVPSFARCRLTNDIRKTKCISPFARKMVLNLVAKIKFYTSNGYIIMIIVDSCMIWFHFECIMQLKKSYYIATNVCSRKRATTFGDLCKVTQKLEPARLGAKKFATLWNLAGASAALQLRRLPNFKAIIKPLPPISRHRDFATDLKIRDCQTLVRLTMRKVGSWASTALLNGLYTERPSMFSYVPDAPAIRPSIHAGNRLES